MRGCSTARLDVLPAADVTVANVLLAPVERILARLESGTAITSGYLVGERPAAPGWVPRDRVEMDGWAARPVRRRQRR